MDFGTAIRTCLSKYGTFTGRARRSEYWFFVLFQFLATLAAKIVDVGFLGAPVGGVNPVSALVALGLFVPMIAVGARRFHDMDRSGWWQLILLIPVVGMIVLIVWFCQRGTAGDNRFGPDPLQNEAPRMAAIT